MATVSPLAHVDPKAHLGEGCEVGPFCFVGPDVVLGKRCKLISNVSILGHTTVGDDNTFFPNSVIGAPPQDKKYKGAPTRLEIGHGNLFREAVTIHCGTEKGGGVTRVGNNGLFMVNSHIGHDAQFGSNLIIANNVMIAGHVVCGDNVNISGAAGVHHFVTIGDFAFIGGAARIHHDVPPFVKVDGADEIRGLNIVGLRRAGFTDDDIGSLDEACRRLFLRRRTAFSQAMAEFDLQNGVNPQVRKMIEFLHRRDQGKHGRYLEALRRK